MAYQYARAGYRKCRTDPAIRAIGASDIRGVPAAGFGGKPGRPLALPDRNVGVGASATGGVAADPPSTRVRRLTVAAGLPAGSVPSLRRPIRGGTGEGGDPLRPANLIVSDERPPGRVEALRRQEPRGIATDSG